MYVIQTGPWYQTFTLSCSSLQQNLNLPGCSGLESTSFGSCILHANALTHSEMSGRSSLLQETRITKDRKKLNWSGYTVGASNLFWASSAGCFSLGVFTALQFSLSSARSIWSRCLGSALYNAVPVDSFKETMVEHRELLTRSHSTVEGPHLMNRSHRPPRAVSWLLWESHAPTSEGTLEQEWHSARLSSVLR